MRATKAEMTMNEDHAEAAFAEFFDVEFAGQFRLLAISESRVLRSTKVAVAGTGSS